MKLLPFFFKKMSPDEYLLINLCGEFVSINHQVFYNLINCNKNGLADKYYILKSKNIVCEDDFDIQVELLSTKLRTKKEYLRHFTTLHMVVVTARCNCFCNYCHASSSDIASRNLDMTQYIAKKTVEMIFNSPSHFIKIEFQGGEPLLNWNIVKYIVAHAKKLNRKYKKALDFVLCTNLTLFDADKAYFCKKHNINISTSLDGDKNLHNAHRKMRNNENTYEHFLKGLGITHKILGKTSCAALLTVTKDHLNKLDSVVHEYMNLGFSSIFLRMLNPYGYAVKNSSHLGYSVEEFIDAYKKTLDYIIDINKNGCYFVEQYAEILLKRILTPFSTGFVDLQSPTGAGISGVVYDYDGGVYPTDESRMLARMGDGKFLMGNVANSSYEEIFRGEIIKDVVFHSCIETIPVCSTCEYQIYCGSDPVRMYSETNELNLKTYASTFCKKNKAIIDYLFDKILNDEEETMNVFWSWITRRPYKEIQCENNLRKHFES